MGCCQSQPDEAYRDAIEIALMDKPKEDKLIKVPLLGTGKCGKSTLFWQLKQIHGDGWKPNEIESNKGYIRSNIYLCMLLLLKKSAELYDKDPIQNKDLCIDFKQDTTTVERIQRLASYQLSADHNDRVNNLSALELSEIGDCIHYLWALPQIKATYHKRGNHFSFISNADYFFDKVVELFQSDYEPSKLDMVKVQIRTTGLCERMHVIDDIKYKFIDTGGQRNERKKWPWLFDNPTGVIFVVSLESMHEVLYEDEDCNAMYETIRLWNEIVNHRWLKHPQMILIFNKNDLFRTWLRDLISNGQKSKIAECLINGFSLNGKTWRHYTTSRDIHACDDDEVEMKELMGQVDQIMNFNYPLLLGGYARMIERDYDVSLPMDVMQLIMLYYDVQFEVFYEMIIDFLKMQFVKCNDSKRPIKIHISTITDRDLTEGMMRDIQNTLEGYSFVPNL